MPLSEGELTWRVENLERRLNGIPERIAVMEERLKETTGAAKEISKNLEIRESSQARERKADRRWLVGTILTATTIVIAAMALLLGSPVH